MYKISQKEVSETKLSTLSMQVSNMQSYQCVALSLKSATDQLIMMNRE